MSQGEYLGKDVAVLQCTLNFDKEGSGSPTTQNLEFLNQELDVLGRVKYLNECFKLKAQECSPLRQLPSTCSFILLLVCLLNHP